MPKMKSKKQKPIGLVLVIVLIFALMGASIWGITKKTYDDMSDAAISNLNENLNLMKSTIEAIFSNEADFQKITAKELAQMDDPQAFVASMPSGELATLVSYVPIGSTEGISNNGHTFDPSKLDFTDQGSVAGLALSRSYVNSLGTWAYTMACPIEQDNALVGTLYMEYIFDTIDEALPRSFYGDQASLYLMDVTNERFVLKPEGMGERDAGHVNLQDFYRANAIDDPSILEMVKMGIEERRNVMFAHDVLGRDSLCFLWSINEGAFYLAGYVPMEAIQKEAKAVNIALMLVACIAGLAFCLCIILFAYNRHKQTIQFRIREAERIQHTEQLSKALQAAQIANESKSVFLANMSHDIRTPMNAVLGFATLINRESDDPTRVREHAQKIMSSGKHLLDLINDVLDISKIESGKATLTLEEFDLGDLLSSIESMIAPMAASKNQTFCAEITNIQNERVISDETHLNQILINLLSNAVKYTPEGGKIWLRFIGLPQRSEHRERIRIEVEDNGYGMSPEFLETIFDAFSRAENSTTNKIQGTGLGMSITKNLVDLLGGIITVESTEGKGSLFSVELELRIPNDQAVGSFWKRAGIKRILMVESLTFDARSMESLMEGTGVQIDAAPSLKDAYELILNNAYDAVLFSCEDLTETVLKEAIQLQGGCTSALASETEGATIYPASGSASGSASATSDDTPLIVLPRNYTADIDDIPLPPRIGILCRPFFLSMLKGKIASILNLDDDDPSQFDDALKGKRFLAAEDNLFNAQLLTDLLELEGASVEIVENGKLAVERFEKSDTGEFHAILMDVQMPIMNGHEASRAIRALERPDAKTIPIFAMTADAFVEDEQAALAAGMDAHLTKPIEIDDLKRVVDHFIPEDQSVHTEEGCAADEAKCI